MAVQFLDAKPPKRWVGPRYIKQREMLNVAAFLGTIGFFTIYGFGTARQTFVSAKIDIVGKHSIKSSSQ